MAGFDFSALFQQAQQLQEQMRKTQEELGRKEVSGQSGGGMVSVTANGKGEILRVKIDPQAVNPQDVAMLEDLVAAAINAALANVRQLAQAEGQGPLANLQNLIPGMMK